ncbi:MAG: EFR1 family ferrodoxin [Deltaproteobacteria bacterium]|nr:EFR1 family ferrodoxin [Candidatus Zymogenaceae bacterium]
MTVPTIAVLYHSGSGSTKLVATVITEKLEQSGSVDLVPISFEYDTGRIPSYRTLVFGFPTYHGNPTRSMREFFDMLPVAEKPIPVHLFITYGLYPDHTFRVAARSLAKKGYITTGHMGLRGPASDGALMLPGWIGPMFRYEKRAPEKIDKFVSGVRESLNGGDATLRMPRYVWYTLLNAPHRLLGEKNNNRCKNRMRVNEGLCTSCGRCVEECIRGCWRMEEEAPVFDQENCEFCLRCIHNCPAGAISFSETSRDKPRLNKKFYSALKPTLYQGVA